jgi:hypothetical protein
LFLRLYEREQEEIDVGMPTVKEIAERHVGRDKASCVKKQKRKSRNGRVLRSS